MGTLINQEKALSLSWRKGDPFGKKKEKENKTNEKDKNLARVGKHI
jgi:hypothetical protein